MSASTARSEPHGPEATVEGGAAAVAVPDVEARARRRLRLPRFPASTFALAVGSALAVASLLLALVRVSDPLVLAASAALAAGLAFAAVRAARPAVSAVPVLVRKQDSMMDVLVSRELARARRHGTQLCVASVRLASLGEAATPGRPAALGEVANEFAGALRVTDVVAYSRTGRRLTVLLTDTSAEDARSLMSRLAVRPGIAHRVLVGLAAFPDEAVTYRALRDLAATREAPLLAANGAGVRAASGHARRRPGR